MANQIKRTFQHLKTSLKKIKKENGYIYSIPDKNIFFQRTPQAGNQNPTPAIYLNYLGIDNPVNAGRASGIRGVYTVVVNYALLVHMEVKQNTHELLDPTLDIQSDVIKAINADIDLRQAAADDGDTDFRPPTQHRIWRIDTEEGLIYPESLIAFVNQFEFSPIQLSEL